MKNDVVRWNADRPHSSSSDCIQHDADPPPAPAPPHRPADSTPKFTATTTVAQKRLANRGPPSAIKCDIDDKHEIYVKSSYLHLPVGHRSAESSCKRRRSGASDLASFNEYTPKRGLVSSSSFPSSSSLSLSSSPTFGASRHSKIDSNRRTVGSLISTKFLLICLQISCVVLLCNLNVGVAVSLTSSHLDEDLNLPELDYEQPDASEPSDLSGHYTHTWAVHIPNGDNGLAEEVARDHGFVNLGKIFDDHYHFAHHKVSKRSLSPASGHQTRLEEDERVHWAVQQKAKSRRKRDFIRMRPSRTSSRSVSLVDAVSFSDPKWPQMWYLNRGGGLDMNVIPAWKEGITGKGIVVTILDDGLELNHPDIEHNYDPKASYDVNSHDENPMPQYDMTDSNRHGTRCAGEVAATANNSLCAVGIAFGASVGGVRMLDGDVTDAVEARSLSLNPQHIDIYSASWGPDDDGKTVDGPGELASRAFIEGVTKGRNGKGSIFIWASGNGGRELDNCNCDGYTNSIWTLSISSATEVGNVPWYSEKCSSTLATTYSSGGPSEKQVVTTDLHHSCTISHTGTSASAPLAAGIAALVLESNQNLTWRDLQHIVVRTAKPANLHDPTWSKNGVGRRISHSFGYGLMDAAAMVKVARTWKTVPEQQRCEINAPHVDKVIPPKGYITLQLTVKHCLSVNYLEHVQAKITLTSQRRGDIQLYLKSPAGTKVTLLTSRIHDVSRSGFNQWPFMSVHTWGESPHGNWQLEIHNQGRYMGHAMLREWSLIFYGTTNAIDPNDPISTPRAFSTDYTTPNTSSTSTTTNLHQIYSPLYPRLPPNNLSVLGGSNTSPVGVKIATNKISPNNKAMHVTTSSSKYSPASENGNNKKQPQQHQKQQKQQSYQQISATYGVILGSQNKGKGKNNGKNKSGEAKNNNKNSNNGKSAVSRKEPTTASTPNAKNKFNKISQGTSGGANNNKTSTKFSNTVLRPKSSSSGQSNEEKPGERKVVGDLTPASSGKTSIKTPPSSQTSNYAKLPLKATKQIKESQSALQSHEKLTNSDQRIPKLFERYEKIQAIFPEFQPYQEHKEIAIIENAPPSYRKPLQIHDLSSSPPYKPSGSNTGTKPSRENSKKSSQSLTQEQRNQDLLKKQKQSLVQATTAVAGLSAVRGVESQLQEKVQHTSKEKLSNAQITQWDLIFYGTEIPAQPDDPQQINTDKFSPYGDGVENNQLSFDSESVSGQWRHVEQVGESSHISSDRTSTACIKATIDQRCLVCAVPTFLYNGRCYLECPPHTYKLSSQRKNSLPDTESIEDIQATDRKRSDEIDYMANNEISAEELACGRCDKSCLRCYGPLNSQCSTCYPGSQLRKALLSNETYCYVFAERSSGNSQDGSTGQHARNDAPSGVNKNIIMFVLILVPAMAVIAFLIFVSSFVGKKLNIFNRREDGDYVYDRVALLPEFDQDTDLEEIPNVEDREKMTVPEVDTEIKT